ncbi:hypothetical protein ACEN2J_13845 [Pseudorhodobacter sp. W20_MBD10_FR17]|uniref:hypothetical protein n=1 Tax=Pseudorhodobacter sp. W20_MBD10_FR17 TaxID=3240266 RepID=UPI003F9A85AF
MRYLVLFPVLAALVGCGTPQERCIAGATRDMRIVDRLIAETQGNLDRGYALEEVERTGVRWETCRRGPPQKDGKPSRPDLCLQEYTFTVTKPRAINLADARQTLAELQKKRAAQARVAAPLVASCKATHPE